MYITRARCESQPAVKSSGLIILLLPDISMAIITFSKYYRCFFVMFSLLYVCNIFHQMHHLFIVTSFIVASLYYLGLWPGTLLWCPEPLEQWPALLLYTGQRLDNFAHQPNSICSSVIKVVLSWYHGKWYLNFGNYGATPDLDTTGTAKSETWVQISLQQFLWWPYLKPMVECIICSNMRIRVLCQHCK